MLWDEFSAEGMSPGPAAIHVGGPADYVLSMHLAAYRVRRNGGPEKRHYALAPQLMATYAEALLNPKASAHDQDVAAAIERVSAQGGLIRRAGAGLIPKNGT